MAISSSRVIVGAAMQIVYPCIYRPEISGGVNVDIWSDLP
jgi:hypothetical protein